MRPRRRSESAARDGLRRSGLRGAAGCDDAGDVRPLRHAGAGMTGAPGAYRRPRRELPGAIMTTRNRERQVRSGLMILLLVLAACADSGTTLPPPQPPPPEPETPIWPISASKAEDADTVHAPFGPRALPTRYDFHAGIDIPAPRGTPVRAVLSGVVVQVGFWNGTSVGAGNAITIRHPSGAATSYLHLDAISVAQGAPVQQGAVVGTVGSTGATYPHLHLGYFPAIINDQRDERLSRNPLELLPYRQSAQSVTATFEQRAVVLDVPLRPMTIVAIEVHGGGQSRSVNYNQIVQQGSTARHEQLQSGLHLDAGRPQDGRFTLRLTPDSFDAERVVVRAIDGSVILDRSR
jgi:murein DD-endopeptidase MepM/ murein hydrolase activator NlpD